MKRRGVEKNGRWHGRFNPKKQRRNKEECYLGFTKGCPTPEDCDSPTCGACCLMPRAAGVSPESVGYAQNDSRVLCQKDQ